MRVRSAQKLPRRPLPVRGEAAYQREGHGDANRCGCEVLNREPGHLDQVAHRGFT